MSKYSTLLVKHIWSVPDEPGWGTELEQSICYSRGGNKTNNDNGIPVSPKGMKTCALRHLSEIISPEYFVTTCDKNMKKTLQHVQF